MEWGINLHTEGPYVGLPQYEPSLLSSPEGRRVSLVAKQLTSGTKPPVGVICAEAFSLDKGLGYKQMFLLAFLKSTILGARLTHLRGPVLKADDGAAILHHRQKDLSHLFQLIETCSGFGALGNGAKHAGWKTVVHNDCMNSFCNHLQSHSKVPVVLGDIGKLETVAKIHEAAPYAASIAFGFSCQPFSRAGDRKEGQDDRAKSLPFGLYAAYLLQLDLVVTECVPEASTSPYVLKCLQQYMQMTNSDRSETLMELAHVWPSRRRRWWSILLKSYMGKVSIPPFPRLKIVPSIACLFPCLMSMTSAELQELTLSTEERMMFEKYGKGLGGHMVNFAEPLPTALHSWGNQCLACACGCRGPLSVHRLQSQGLFGVLAHVPGQTPDQNVRHLSGREMALLTGFPKDEGWTDHQRLLTAGVGQLASPMQAVWVFAAVFNHLIDHGFCLGDSIPPQQLLACVAMDVFKLRDEWFGNNRTVAMDPLFQEQFELFLEPQGANQSAGSFQDLTMSQDDDILPGQLTQSKRLFRTRLLIHVHPNWSPRNVMSTLSPSTQFAEEDISCKPPLPKDSTEVPIGAAQQPGKTESSTKDPADTSLTSMNLAGQVSPRSFTNGCSNAQSQPSSSISHQGHADKTVSHDSLTNQGSSLPVIPATPMWTASGAISAFATCPEKMSSIPKSIGKNGPTSESSVQAMPIPLTASPAEIATTGIMIYDADHHSISHQKCSPQATYAQWLAANQEIDQQVGQCYDIFGGSIHPDTELIHLKWIVVAQAPLEIHQMSLQDRMCSLTSFPRIESSLLQGPSVASDEMMFYLTAIATVGPC